MTGVRRQQAVTKTTSATATSTPVTQQKSPTSVPTPPATASTTTRRVKQKQIQAHVSLDRRCISETIGDGVRGRVTIAPSQMEPVDALRTVEIRLRILVMRTVNVLLRIIQPLILPLILGFITTERLR